MAGKVQKTSQEYLNEVNIIWNNHFELITEYMGAKQNITLRHIPCNREITKRADAFKRTECDLAPNLT